MNASSRLTVSAILAGGAFALACGGDSGGGPVTPQTLVVAAGDTQSALTESMLPIPLRVRLTGSDGGRFAGATVTWSVTAGAATLGAASSVTDDTGSASTTVTLGPTPGQIAVRAAVDAVPAVTFTATGCDYPPVTLDAVPLSGALSTTDCRFGGYYTDFLSLDQTSGQREITISDSAAFDTYVELYTFSGDFVGFEADFDEAVILPSRLHAIVAPGNYLVAPSSWDQFVTGPYGVSVVSRALGLVNCERVWVTRGVVVTDSVTTNDCTDGSGGYYDVVGIFAAGGSVLRINQRSTALDARLRLLNSSGQQVAINDDSATATNDAFLAYTAPLGDVYYVLPGTAAPGETGAYTLEVAASTTLSGMFAAPASLPLRFAPLRLPKAWPLPMRGRGR